MRHLSRPGAHFNPPERRGVLGAFLRRMDVSMKKCEWCHNEPVWCKKCAERRGLLNAFEFMREHLGDDPDWLGKVDELTRQINVAADMGIVHPSAETTRRIDHAKLVYRSLDEQERKDRTASFRHWVSNR